MKKLYTLLSLCIPFSGFAQSSHSCSNAKMNHRQRQPVISLVQQVSENKYDVKFEHLSLDVERDSPFIKGNVHTRATVTASVLDSFAFELHPDLTIDSIRINGSLAAPVRGGSYGAAPVPTPALIGTTVDVVIYYHGTPPSGASAAVGNGFSNGTSGSWGNQASWSLSESFAASEWWPCKQSLQDKIDSSWVFITTDTANKAGSNGLLSNVVQLGNGKKRFEWKNNHTIDYYLISVAVAKYVDYSFYAHPFNSPNPVLIQNYVYDNPATLSNFKPVIDKTKDFLELFAKLNGPYPFADQKYGHCMAPFGGGMEHQTMTSIGYFDFATTAHELMHQWFGDNVTCKTWSDIFVNEGFASYSEYLAFEYLDSVNAAPHMLNQHNNIMSQPGGSIWFTDSTNTVRIFDSRLSYDKGSAMMHWLRFIVNNDSAYFHSYQNYQKQFKNSTATALDYKLVLETATGMNFTQFYKQWFYGEGYPTFGIRWNQVGTTFYLESTETTSMPSVTPLFITPVQYRLTRSIGDTLIRLNQVTNKDGYSFQVKGTVTGVVVDPLNWIVNDVNGNVHDNTLAGVNEQSGNQSDISINPNPAQSKLNLVFTGIAPEGMLSLTVFDLSGKKVSAQSFTQAGSTDVSDLAPGIYIVKITDAANTVLKVMKFVKE
jgi:aminopeptidase N